MIAQVSSRQLHVLVHTLGLLVVASGCSTWSGSGSPSPSPSAEPVVQADASAVVAVVEDAYARWGYGSSIVFLDADQACDSTSPECGSNGEVSAQLLRALEVRLLAKVLPDTEARSCDGGYCWPPTGESGVIVQMGRFEIDESGDAHVSVTLIYAPLACIGREVVLRRTDRGWVVRPDPPDQPPPPYWIC